MPQISVVITRYVEDEPFPGLVECQFVDASGTRRLFIDKAPLFSVETLSRRSRYPAPGVIACEVVSRYVASDGRRIARVTTRNPDGVEATDGSDQFDVLEDQLADVT